MISDFPLVSIITPVYNGSKFLDELIESVRNQDYPNVEHIIIDDGSKDNGATVAILNHHPHLNWWSQTNCGQYPTQNEGLKVARGVVACFISADDLMLPGAIRHAVEYLQLHPNCEAVFGNYLSMDEGGKQLVQIHPFRHTPACFYPYTHHICHASLYVYRDFLINNELWFNDKLHYVGDYEWIIRILKRGGRIDHIRVPLSKIRIHAGQTTQVHFMAMRQETIDVQKQQGISLFLNSIVRKVMFISRLLNELVNNGPKTFIKALVFRLRLAFGPRD
jgi:glycosyltransferase involved in cell wall biosynthesis